MGKKAVAVKPAALVFLDNKSDEPFTTSDIIAENTGNSYRSIQRTIENQINRKGRKAKKGLSPQRRTGHAAYHVLEEHRYGGRLQGGACPAIL